MQKQHDGKSVGQIKTEIEIARALLNKAERNLFDLLHRNIQNEKAIEFKDTKREFNLRYKEQIALYKGSFEFKIVG